MLLSKDGRHPSGKRPPGFRKRKVIVFNQVGGVFQSRERHQSADRIWKTGTKSGGTMNRGLHRMKLEGFLRLKSLGKKAGKGKREVSQRDLVKWW